MLCSIEGCESSSYQKGWCSKHYQRWRRNGDPTVTVRKEKGHTDPSYVTVHKRLQNTRGRAAMHCCVICSSPAVHWAYNRRDPNQQIDKDTGFVYSYDLNNYNPMCADHHNALDQLDSRNRVCTIEGCGKKHKAKGLCNTHYNIEWRSV